LNSPEQVAGPLVTWIRRIEDGVLALLLGSLILIAGGQILLRNAFSIGLPWTDELLRLLVLWLALVGAVAASRGDRHIAIDLLSRFLPSAWIRFVTAFTSLFTAAICGILGLQSWTFVSDSREFEDQLLGDLPAWPFQIVLPVAFALMALRYLLYAGSQFTSSGRPLG
jgi:TRAP-type C4-dicarboxylate transport system permease small subunit